MTQEEKAKAYDEAIRKLRGMMPNWDRLSYNGNTFIQDLIHIFPELKESEGERIRKEIIKYFENYSGGDNISIKFTEWIAWLKKQGTSYTKRDVDDAYVEGMAFAKDELEKQNSAWSEEDDSMFQSCIGAVATNDYYKGEEKEQIYDWLKSLKQKLK